MNFLKTFFITFNDYIVLLTLVSISINQKLMFVQLSNCPIGMTHVKYDTPNAAEFSKVEIYKNE